MAAPSQSTDISFNEVVRRGYYKWGLILAIAIILSGFAGALGIYTMVPENHEGTTSESRFELVVPESAEPPLRITISHTYSINVVGRWFEVVDGPDQITYNVTIENADGLEIFKESKTIEMPALIAVTEGQKSYTVTETYECRLKPGKYYVEILSTSPIDYKFEQGFKYSSAAIALFLLGVLGILIFAGAVLMALRKRDAIKREAAIAAFAGAPHRYGYAPHPGSPYFDPYGHKQSPPSTTCATPEDLSRGLSSSLTYVPGGVVVDYVCGRCGNLIQNPPVQGVITCERCGEREYVQGP